MPPHTQPSNYISNAHQWCVVIGKPGSAQLEGTPATDLELKGILMTFLFVCWFICLLE